MKSAKIFSSFFIITLLVFSSCKEEMNLIDYSKPQSSSDTTYIISPVPSAQQKQVLIEDLSGVRCPNCPTAGQIGNGIVAANPGKVNIYTIYPNVQALNQLTAPVNNNGVISKYELRTNIGGQILGSLTTPSTLPMGYIDRKIYSPNIDWLNPKENWSGIVNAEIALATSVNIDLEKTYDAASKNLSIIVTVTFTQSDTGSKYLSVVLLQDSIVDAQENSSGFDSTYLHRHVLMDMLTSASGNKLNQTSAATLTPGRVFKITYQKTLDTRTNSIPSGVAGNGPPLPPPQWDPKHMIILAFVTDGTTKNVLQSNEIDVMP